MPTDILKTPIEYLKGVGPQRAELLNKELNIFCFEDLLLYYPFRYVDKSKFYLVKEIHEDLPYVQIRGTISNLTAHGTGRTTRMTAEFRDHEGGIIELIWFNGFKWLKSSFTPGREYIVFGRPARYGSKYNIAHPEIEELNPDATSQTSGLHPVYSSTEKLKSRGLDSKGISKLMKALLIQIKDYINETLPGSLREKTKTPPRRKALIHVHFPTDLGSLQKALAGLKFEELFFLQMYLLKIKQIRLSASRGQIFRQVGDHFNIFYKHHLQFELTNAQKRVIKEIRQDTLGGKQMNRLLQGDVGSGKTIVALLCMLISCDNGFQSCLMAPTEVLANQHHEGISELLKDMPIKVRLLTGNTKAKDRRVIFSELAAGEIDILIGTHALIEDTVIFKDLGFIVIDEQHRFGVAQRAKLWKKNIIPPHVLVMTATPIPRTLAMTLYGDLDVSSIDELPPGRKPIKTIHQFDSNRLKIFGFMRQQIELGRQVYVVYPLIEESKKLDLKDLKDGYESIVRAFPLPKYAVSIVHGQMKAADKDYEMQRFVRGETQIMVATTVIEVGINVPNASIMVIENAERFGLSQLHQLRGRVGRGADQSWCVLMTSFKLTNEAKKRLETMVATNDGFKIAEMDLKLRGPGEIHGTRQSGELELKIADLSKDEKILRYARDMAIDILKDDPQLQKPDNMILKTTLNYLYKGKVNWSKIS